MKLLSFFYLPKQYNDRISKENSLKLYLKGCEIQISKENGKNLY